jgi:hypothetical protein
MILAALALSACLLQELTIEELIQHLESGGVREREEALGAVIDARGGDEADRENQKPAATRPSSWLYLAL